MSSVDDEQGSESGSVGVIDGDLVESSLSTEDQFGEEVVGDLEVVALFDGLLVLDVFDDLEIDVVVDSDSEGVSLGLDEEIVLSGLNLFNATVDLDGSVSFA